MNTQTEIEKLEGEIEKIYREIDSQCYWMDGTRSPIIPQRRGRGIKLAKKRIEELQSQINQLRK